MQTISSMAVILYFMGAKVKWYLLFTTFMLIKVQPCESRYRRFEKK